MMGSQIEINERDIAALFDATFQDQHGWRTKTLGDLEWFALENILRRHLRTDPGFDALDKFGPLPSSRLAETRLVMLRELWTAFEAGDEPPVVGARAIEEAVGYAEKHGVLAAEDLECIRRNCEVVSRTKRFFASQKEAMPINAEFVAALDACSELAAVIGQAVEPGGRLTDDASPDMRRLRRAVANQTDRIKSKVDSMLQSEELETSLQDDYFTVRGDRYVLPIRVGAKTRVGGVVHGYSSSGQTAFIEPQELVELNNQLRWAQIALVEEEQRVLVRLSEAVAEHGNSLRLATKAIAFLDLHCGLVRFGREIGGTLPTFTTGELNLKELRHPMLVVKLGEEFPEQENPTVANDVVIEADTHVLIVSGPNTGGKTVLLKSIGLAVMLSRCGAPVAAKEAELPWMTKVFTDIGDDQSIANDLSTFSSHLVNIRDFLSEADSSSLVLLDELFTGTDPMQGAALARGLLEVLAEGGVKTVVTTHLESLKTLALDDERFGNSSMGFNVETLQPTYRLTLGLPGSSYALRVAKRLGFPDSIVERARDVLDDEGRLGVDEILRRLEEQSKALEKEQRRLDHERREAERQRKKFQAKHEKLVTDQKEAINQRARELSRQIDQALGDFRQQQKLLKKSDSADEAKQKLRAVQKKIDGVRVETESEKPSPDGLMPVSAGDLDIGLYVYSQSFKRTAEVLAYDVDGNVQVQIGMMKAQVKRGDLYHTQAPKKRAPSTGKVDPMTGETEWVPQTSRNTVDLRGLRVDEALEMLDLYLDSAFLNSQRGAHIIHGHGTGALKRAVRGFLPQSKYVDEFRRGDRGEGGDGVTVVRIAVTV